MAGAKAKVVYQEAGKVRSIIGIIEDIGWGFKVKNPRNNEEYMIINKQYIIKVVNNPKYENENASF